ncbi:MAG: gamma-glutamylcyclotransferase [Deltaproteobacteria bacterium]|nr:MAG: gamma-glutamylcyclotransferase [Deltaproteobacteria bacterium]
MNVFGYGSLIWRPDFPFAGRYWARLDGWERRFWQGSPDHRGTPEAPGRVVTLVPGEAVWGVVFELPADTAETTMARLDVREQGGYELVERQVHAEHGPVVARTFVATPDNPEWLGPDTVTAMAAHIARSHGPSGANREYLLRLADALEQAGVLDAHTRGLAAAVRRLP